MQPSRVSFCTYYSLKCLFIIFIIHYKDPKTKNLYLDDGSQTWYIVHTFI